MDSLTYLLVCEGPTDISVIKEISKRISANIGKNIIIQELSPQRDATTNRYPSHGWEEVRSWCKMYGKTVDTGDNPFAILAAKRTWKALLKASRAHGLIIQMDTDIAQYIGDLNPRYTGSTKNERKRFCQKAILNWLGEPTKPNNIYLLLSTNSTETWILATHSRADAVFHDLSNGFDFEEISNVVDRLITLGYRTYLDNETNRVKFSKDLSLYQNYAEKIANNLVKVRLESEEAEKLCQKFES